MTDAAVVIDIVNIYIVLTKFSAIVPDFLNPMFLHSC